jgi:hypothetical protein
VVRAELGTQAFWKHPELVRDYCTDMVLAWMDGKAIGEVFHEEILARPGDVVAYGDKWEDCTFAIWLSDGRVATTIINPNCWGVSAPKLLMVRAASLKMQGRQFNVGVHVDG